MILQEQVTLDEAVLQGSGTFKSGCDFAFYFDSDGVAMEYGCYGIHVSLITGHRRLLHLWYTGQFDAWRKFWVMAKPEDHHERVHLPVAPETIMALKMRKPCEQCGQPYFKARVQTRREHE